MLLMIDNYDSFTFNLVQYFRELGQEVVVHRNDAISLMEIERLQPEYIVISPGPCTPDDSGISMEVIHHFSGKIPILGVCLGHQAICQAFGGKIVKAPKVVHGYTSEIYHHAKGIFREIPTPFSATRYHSLVIDKELLSDAFYVTAWTQPDDSSEPLIMGIEHKNLPIHGIQFHPESILTEHGHLLLKNFLASTVNNHGFTTDID